DSSETFRDACHGLAQLGAALGSISESVPAAGGIIDPARGLGPLSSELRFLDQHRARLAHHDLSSLLRRGRDLFGIRDGVVAGYSSSALVSPGRHDHDAPHRMYGEGDARYRADRRVR